MAKITARKNANGTTSYIAQVRRIGFPSMTRAFPSKTAATIWMADTEKRIRAGSLGASERMTFNQLLDEAEPRLGKVSLSSRHRILARESRAAARGAHHSRADRPAPRCVARCALSIVWAKDDTTTISNDHMQARRTYLRVGRFATMPEAESRADLLRALGHDAIAIHFTEEPRIAAAQIFCSADHEMRPPPSFAVYASDDLASSKYFGLSAGERGLLDSMNRAWWVERRLPRQAKLLARVVRLDVADVERNLTPAVLVYFEADASDPESIHPTELMRQFERTRVGRERMSIGGQKGAKTTNKKRRKPAPVADSHGTPQGTSEVLKELKELKSTSSLGNADVVPIDPDFVKGYETGEPAIDKQERRVAHRKVKL